MGVSVEGTSLIAGEFFQYLDRNKERRKCGGNLLVL